VILSPRPEIIIGSPGCGKTTALLAEVEKELSNGTPPDRLGLVTFTRRAAEEAVTRAASKFNLTSKQLPHFRTLHSLCFRALGLTHSDVFAGNRVREFADWAGIRITGRYAEDGDLSGHAPGDRALHLEHLARVRGVPLREQYDTASDDLPWREVERCATALSAFKRSRGLLDFTDMLSEVVRSSDCLPRLDVIICDEIQDNSRLQWLVIWKLAARARRFVVAGDDDQCHPPGTLILTTKGQKKIECLASSDRVIQYDRRSQEFRWAGYEVTVAKHNYSGWMLDINGTKCTQDHRLWVKWIRKTGFVVYLMKKGDDVRVGWCQLFNADKAFHLEIRRRMEKADSLWVLKWFESKQDASFYEQEMSIKYALPTILFTEASSGNTLYTQKALDVFFDKVRGQAKWRDCLSDHFREPHLPLLDNTGFSRKRSTLFLLHAANLIPETCAVPKLKNKRIEWVNARVQRQWYEGTVYGLDAPPHRYYVADNTVVHNCIFRWAGADVEGIVTMAGDERVLGQSHRVPISVQTMADGIIKAIPPGRRRQKRWAPRAEPGEIIRAADLGEVDTVGEWEGDVQPILMLTRNVYLLREQVIPELRRAGVIFSWGDRQFPDRELCEAAVTWEHLRAGKSASAARVRGCLRLMSRVERGHKELPGVPDDEELTLEALEKNHGLRTRAIWTEALDRMPADDAAHLVAARQRGERLLHRPRVRLSTIHAAKGGEARHVVLTREMATRTHAEMTGSLQGEEDERRVFYVGVTRAREKLTVVEPKRREACPWV